MRNTFKKFFSLVLALIMTLCSSSAFAAEENKSIKWDIYNSGNYYEFDYAGVFADNNLVINGRYEEQIYMVYYELDIPQAGYYIVSTKHNGYYDILFPEIFESDIAYSSLNGKHIGVNPENETNIQKNLYYFPAGETVMGVYYCETELEISLEFFGEKITDIEFEDNAFCGILGHNIAEDSGNGDMTAHGISAEIVFSSGKKLSVENMNFAIETKNNLVKGENPAEVVLFEYREPITVTIFEITDYIKSVELKNPESITVKKYYNGDLGEIEFNEAEEFVVTFTDGTTANSSNTVVLPNGKDYFIRTSVTGWGSDNPVIQVDVAQYTFGEYDVPTVEADREENFQYLKNINSVRWAAAIYDARQSIEYLKTVDGTDEKIYVIFWFPTIYTSVFFDIFCNIVEFIEYGVAI